MKVFLDTPPLVHLNIVAGEDRPWSTRASILDFLSRHRSVLACWFSAS